MAGAHAIINKNVDFFDKFDRMVSFDRRAYHSVITYQLGKRGCSEEFAKALAEQLNAQGLGYRPDPTGIYTDSASFIGIIPEVTNLSVGYFHEHSHGETQDIEFLDRLAKAACKVKWEELPIGVKTEDKLWWERERTNRSRYYEEEDDDDYTWGRNMYF
jgi:hypothetical protein